MHRFIETTNGQLKDKPRHAPAMTDDPARPRLMKPTTSKRCSRCDGGLVFDTNVHTLANQSGFFVFRCDACSKLQWHAKDSK